MVRFDTRRQEPLDAPAPELRPQSAGGCCGTPATEATAGMTVTDDAAVADDAAAPCCGTAQAAHASGSCCGSGAKAEAVAAGAGCC